MSKFKKGDRVIWVTYGNRGVVLEMRQRSCFVGFDVGEPEEVHQGTIRQEALEFEHIYDSPLYDAIK